MKQTQAIIATSISGTVLACTVAYGIAFGLKMPLPFINDGVYKPDYAVQNTLMNQWNNVVLQSEHIPVVEKVNLDAFTEIDKATVESYMANNSLTDISSLYVDSLEATGIKTTDGEDIIAIDVVSQAVLVDTLIDGAKTKVAILKNNDRVSLSVVEDLTYWSHLDEHAKKTSSVVSINANDYTWNDTGNYGKVYGLVKSHDNVIRRSQKDSNVYGFNSEGKLIIGDTGVNQGSEANEIVIKDGQIQGNLDTSKAARTLIGQSEDGTVYMVVVDGNEGSQGVTTKAVADYMQKYNLVTLASASGGKCTTMTWKNKIVNTPFGESTGIKLPTAWVYR